MHTTTTKTSSGRRRAHRGGRPTKADAALVEERILSVASELFARDGYAATSIDRVAAVCEAGKDTIYRRYPSKRALFDAVIERARSNITARLQKVIDREPARDSLSRLKDTTRWLLDVNLDPELVAFKRIALSEMLIADGKRQGPAPDEIMKLLMACVSAAQADRHLITDDTVFLTNQLLASIIGGPTTLAMYGFRPLASKKDRNAYFEKTWGIFISGARRS